MRIMRLPLALMLAAKAAADGLADMVHLQTMTANISETVDNSVMLINNTVFFPSNDTSGRSSSVRTNQTYSIAYAKDLPTASILQTLIETIGAAGDNLAKQSRTEWHNGQNVSIMSAAYMMYIDEMPNLAQALISRGHAWHNEANQPVYLAIQSLTSVVHTFSYALASKRIIGQAAIIRTLTAGSKLITSQTVWSNIGTLPGLR